MKAIIINENINTKDFKYNDEVEIVTNNTKLFGKTLKKELKVNSKEVVIKKIQQYENNQTIVIAKCNKDDLKIIDDLGVENNE